MKFNKILSIILINLILLSCGKDVESTKRSPFNSSPDQEDSRRRSRTVSIPEGEFFSGQKLLCANPIFCPDNIAKVVVTLNDQITYCTGTLIEQDKLLTSASCLPRTLRIPRLRCDDNVVAVFPSTIKSEGEVVACDEIEFINENLFTEAALWQNDLVVLKLGKKMNRSLSRVSSQGVRAKESLVGWTVDYINDKDAMLRKTNCITQLGTFLNPFSDEQYSSMVVMSGCDLNESSSGTAFMRGKDIVSVISKEMTPRFYSYLRNSNIVDGELSRYYHASNVSCSESNAQGIASVLPEECFEVKTIRLLDQKRAKVLSSEDIHKEQMQDILNQIELPSKYFKWDIDFKAGPRKRSFELTLSTPKCINNSSLWVSEYTNWRRRIAGYARVQFEIPKYTLMTKLNSSLLPVSVAQGPEMVNYQVEFNPWDAHVNQKTYIKLSTVNNGNVTLLDNTNISGSCF